MVNKWSQRGNEGPAGRSAARQRTVEMENLGREKIEGFEEYKMELGFAGNISRWAVLCMWRSRGQNCANQKIWAAQF